MAAHVEELGIGGTVTLTAGDTNANSKPYGKLFRVNCTVAGNVAAVLADDTVEIIAVSVGYQCFPYRVKRVNSTNTTATATYANLM